MVAAFLLVIVAVHWNCIMTIWWGGFYVNITFNGTKQKINFTFSFHYSETKMQKNLTMCSYLKILISLLLVLSMIPVVNVSWWKHVANVFRMTLIYCKMHDIRIFKTKLRNSIKKNLSEMNCFYTEPAFSRAGFCVVLFSVSGIKRSLVFNIF